MIGDITQQNLYLIIPSKVSRIADILTTKENISLIDAIKKSMLLPPIKSFHRRAQRCGMKVRWIFTMIS